MVNAGTEQGDGFQKKKQVSGVQRPSDQISISVSLNSANILLCDENSLFLKLNLTLS